MLKKQKLGKYIFLNIITLGVYGLFFWSKWTDNVNTLCDGDDKDSANYILVYILDWFSLGIYSLVWNYRMAERMYQVADDYGVEIKRGGMFVLIWRIFFPLICSITKIKNANLLIDAYNANFDADAVEAEAETEAQPE